MTRWNGSELTPLNDIYGQEIAKKILRNSFNSGRLASTYLFYGDDGLGKWAMAVALAALINCEKPVTDESGAAVDACGKCLNCHQILNLSFPEMSFAVPIPPHRSESDAASLILEYLEEKRKEPYKIITSTRQLTIPISVAREIKRKTAIKPPEGTKRVILFHQMEKMLAASADSLLKLIEEPPPETIIILTARDPENLLPTIQSRSQKIAFRSITAPEIAGYVQEKYNLSPEKAEFYSRLAEGSLGRAVSLVSDEDSSVREVSFLMFKALFQKDNPSAFAAINELINPNNRGETEEVLLFWQSFISDLMLLKYGRDSSGLVNIDLTKELEKLTGRVAGSSDLCALVENIKNMHIAVKRNAHIRPAMAAFVFNFKKHIRQST